MLSRLSRQGFSLIEAVLSTFLLLTAVLLSIYVFHSSLRAEVNNEKRVVAAMVAESALAQIRSSAGESFRGLAAAYDGTTWSLDEAPEFSITARVQPVRLGLACLELESQYPLANRFPEPEARILERSAANVTVVVSWKDPSPQSISVEERVVNLRPSTDFRVELLDQDGGAAQPVALAKGATAGYRARARADGQLIDDIQFTWYVQPLTGFGSLTAVSRDGLRCEYRNAYRNFNNRLRYAPGACYLMVKATYQGRESLDRIQIDNEP